MKHTLLNIVTCLSILIATTAVADDSCIVPEEHDAISYLLIDRSDALENRQAFTQSLEAAEKMVKPGERLVIGVSTAKGSDTRVLFDLVKPKGSLWLSPMKTRAATKKFTDCFAKVEAELADKVEEYKHSALLETLLFVSKILTSDAAQSKRLFMHSDMMQNSETVSFYSLGTADKGVLMKRVEKELLLGKFRGVDVWISGTGATVDDKRDRQLEAFWTEYFDQGGATVKFYGPVLLASS